MESGDKLGHVGHLHFAGDIGADAATEAKAADDQQPAHPITGGRDEERGDHGDGHADHAVEIALAGGTGLESPRSARMKSTPATR